MAIKGKGRTRATRRGIAAAPRPHLVIPRKPLFRRRGVQVTVGLVLVAGITALVLVGLSTQRRNQQIAAEREDASSFSAFVEEVLRRRAVGQPFLTDYLILPDLGTGMSQLKAGEAQEGQLAEQARGWSTRAAEAAEDIAELEPEMAELREGRNLMRRSLELYSATADSLIVAASLEGRSRRELIASLEKQLLAAAQVWDIGWGKVTTVKAGLGILEPAPLPQPGQPGGLPGAGG